MAINIHSPSPLSKLTDMFARHTTHPTKQPLTTRLATRLATWRRERQAEAELVRLSDRELADIGITRQTIHAAVRTPRPYR